MSKGFILMAENSDVDYVRMACALALSIKNTQPKEISNISIITDDPIPEKYHQLFDHIIPIPWKSNQKTRYAVDNRWKIYHASPYEENISLDVDMLVLEDITSFWKVFENYKIYFTSKIVDYRNNIIFDTYYRKAFLANNLPNYYSALHYFHKSDQAKEFYKWVEIVTNNWQLFYGKFISEFYPDGPSMDLTNAVVAKILSEKNEFTGTGFDCIKFTHMKPMIQSWRKPPLEWLTAVGTYVDDECNLKIGNFKQRGIFHYTEKNFLKDFIITKLENRVGI
jgi:hypothetical protein